jgi:hypothetical protein
MKRSVAYSDLSAWSPVTREEALRLCERVPVVVRGDWDLSVPVPFGPGTVFYSAYGPYDYASLRYYALLAEPSAFPALKSKGRIPPPPPKESEADEAGSETPAEDPLEEVKQPPAIRIVKLDCEGFAALEESVLIQFAIDGDLSLAESIHLRVASRKNPDQYLVERKVETEPKASGSFQWDGKVADGAYPGCLNLAGSPYLLQLGLASKGGSLVYTNKVGIKVELAQTELAVGDPSGVGEEDSRGNQEMLALLKEELKKTPDQGTVRLPGSFFKDGLEEMQNNASYTVYGDRLKQRPHRRGSLSRFRLCGSGWIPGRQGTGPLQNGSRGTEDPGRVPAELARRADHRVLQDRRVHDAHFLRGAEPGIPEGRIVRGSDPGAQSNRYQG